MLLHDTMRVARVRHGDERHHSVGLPVQAGGDIVSQAHLDVEAAQRLLEIAERGLDLHDEEPSRRGMECEDVDPAAISEVIEADLDADLPPEVLQSLRDDRHERGVASVDESIEPLAVPPHLEARGRADRRQHAINDGQRHASQVATLEA